MPTKAPQYRGEPRKERREAFIATKRMHPVLTIALIAQIVERTPSEVEGFLYDARRAPAWVDLFCLHKFLARSHRDIPIALARIVARRTNRIGKIADQHSVPGGTTKRVGKRKFRPRVTYVYQDKAVSALEISAEQDRSIDSIYRVIRKNEAMPGDDITALVDGAPKEGSQGRGRVPKQYRFHDRAATIREIVGETGLSYNTVYRRIRKAGCQAAEDVTAVVETHNPVPAAGGETL